MSNLIFTEAPRNALEKRITQIWLVQSALNGLPLGQIKWFGRWRKYCFFPDPTTVFDSSCMIEICMKIEYEMSKRKGKDIEIVESSTIS